MISLKSIEMVFHKGTADENTVLSNLSLTVNDGDFITIIGSNGAGKSTLFNVIAGSLTPTRGQILLNDKDITRQPEYRRAANIGRIFQNPSLGTAAGMTIEENMVLYSKKGFKDFRISLEPRQRSKFQDLLKELDMGLENRLKDSVQLLSGGQRQALTLLMMVMSKPGLILLDEHTAALDPKNAGKVLELTRRFIEQYKLTAMMVTHNMKDAIEYGNRLLMMDQGEIILDVRGAEKKGLTVESLVQKFHDIRHQDFESDKVLLSERKV